MKIEVKSTQVEYRQIQTKNGPRDRYEQTAYVHKDGEPYPEKFTITHQTNSPLAPGFYSLSDCSYRVGRYGDIEINPYDKKFQQIK